MHTETALEQGNELMAEIEYKFYGLFSDIADLADVWKTVECPHVFQTFAFVSSWFLLTKDCEQPAIVVGYHLEKPFGILPACVTKWNTVRTLSWAPTRMVLDYGDILFNPGAPVSPEEFMRRALDLAKKKAKCRFACFDHVREDANCYPFLRREFLSAAETLAPYLAAGQPFDAVVRKVREARSTQKANSERNLRRLSEKGSVELTILRGGTIEAESALAFIFKHKKEQFKHRRIMIDYPHYADWYFKMLECDRTACVVCLTLDGAPIAGLFGFLWNQRLYYLVPAFDADLAKLAPGRVLFYLLLKRCSEDIKVFDLCIGAAGYKLEWTNASCRVCNWVEPTVFGSIAYGASRTVQWAASLRHRAASFRPKSVLARLRPPAPAPR